MDYRTYRMETGIQDGASSSQPGDPHKGGSADSYHIIIILFLMYEEDRAFLSLREKIRFR